LIERLDARERQILLLRYGLGGQPPLTQLETAQVVGISRSYVSRLETRALEQLRARWEQ
ncbi:MAG: RNA polymerase subunit sigma-70, partial [Candidatus Faecalibacterium intestinavium]|nr:RNA polymerase subunit sigma-70 [Candidatus Faecalibacterium intestinavium]